MKGNLKSVMPLKIGDCNLLIFGLRCKDLYNSIQSSLSIFKIRNILRMVFFRRPSTNNSKDK